MRTKSLLIDSQDRLLISSSNYHGENNNRFFFIVCPINMSLKGAPLCSE